VACSIELAGGRVLAGHVGVCDGVLEAGPPTVVNDAGVAFDLGQPPHPGQQEAFAATFGAPFAAIFPVRWQLCLPLAGEAAYREGELALPQAPAPRVH
jgi:hypothetical protein